MRGVGDISQPGNRWPLASLLPSRAGSAEEPGPGGGAPAVPSRAFADECPLGIPGDVAQRVADVMEDGDVGVRALEVADEVEITVRGGLGEALVGPPQQAGYPRCRGERVALVLHPARVVVSGQA